MNIKLHTPKSLKTGSGMATVKQLLLSVVATSISIALTFGTAAIVDSNKKEKEKREIVMMVMYDMYNSLQSLERADSMIHASIDIQRQIARDTSRFETLRFQLAHNVPTADYTETTEHIFSSSIETINTVGNVLFTENVAGFYKARRDYKTLVCDSIAGRITRDYPFNGLMETLTFNYSFDALISAEMLKNMRHLFAQCQQMMGVSDEEIDVYRKERRQVEVQSADGNDSALLIDEDVIRLQQEIDRAVEELSAAR